MKRALPLIVASACINAAHAEPAGWRVTTTGAGPVRIGMTISQAAKALKRELVASDPIVSRECYYLVTEPRIDGLFLMVSQQTVVRIDIESARFRTVSGAGVGDTEQQVTAIYGAGLETKPHHYAPDGNYLTIWSRDRMRAVRFETSNGKVTSLYVGRKPEVEYVEGCS